MNAPAARRTPVALTIAGSDSGGGAGVAADLKAFARCGVHGTCAITAITAQNTVGVSAIESVRPEIVLAQVRAVMADIGVDAVKVGMLGTAEVTRTVARALDELPAGIPVVVDPVMVAESGARLLDEEAQDALVQEILPRASVLTPNLPEARALVGAEIGDAPVAVADATAAAATTTTAAAATTTDADGAIALARAVLKLGPRAVVLTGGHRERAVDLLVVADLDRRGGRPGGDRRGERSDAPCPRAVEIPGVRHPDGAAHGSGCTHSAVLAARLALGDTLLDAATVARALAGEAVANGLRELGAGAGPVDVIGLARMRDGA